MIEEQSICEDRLRIQRFDQERTWYCGAACAAMFAKHFSKNIVQSDAYAQIHNAERFAVEYLYSDPRGIMDYLNQLALRPAQPEMIDFDALNAAGALDCILQNIRYRKWPSISLTKGGDHWIVVDGIRYAEEEAGARRYLGVYVQNPWKGTPPELYVDALEFSKEWLTPNQWGVAWLNKTVVMATGAPKRFRNNSLVLQLSRIRSAPKMVSAQDPRHFAKSLLDEQGFAHIRLAAGGGAVVSTPLRVLDEDNASNYWIAPLDATENEQFADFIYVAISETGDRLFEIANMSVALNIPTASEAKQDLLQRFPDTAIDVEDQLRWSRSRMTPSRFDVYRRIQLGDRRLLYLKTGDVVESLAKQSAGG